MDFSSLFQVYSNISKWRNIRRHEKKQFSLIYNENKFVIVIRKMMDQYDGPRWWAKVMGQDDEPRWWTKMMGQYDGPRWWTKMMGQGDGPRWWAKMMSQDDGPRWWANMMGQDDGPRWWTKMMDQDDGPRWRRVWQPCCERRENSAVFRIYWIY